MNATDLAVLNTEMYACSAVFCTHGCVRRVARNVAHYRRTHADLVVPDLSPPRRRVPIRAPLTSYEVRAPSRGTVLLAALRVLVALGGRR